MQSPPPLPQVDTTLVCLKESQTQHVETSNNRNSSLNKLSIEETYLKLTKAVYDTPITDIMLNNKGLKVFQHSVGKY